MQSRQHGVGAGPRRLTHVSLISVSALRRRGVSASARIRWTDHIKPGVVRINDPLLAARAGGKEPHGGLVAWEGRSAARRRSGWRRPWGRRPPSDGTGRTCRPRPARRARAATRAEQRHLGVVPPLAGLPLPARAHLGGDAAGGGGERREKAPGGRNLKGAPKASPTTEPISAPATRRARVSLLMACRPRARRAAGRR